MSGRLVAVVRCADRVDGVYNAVRSLLQGERTADGVALVADPATPASAEPWLTAFCERRGIRLVRVASQRPGMAWNAGLRACGPADRAVCLEAGDELAAFALAAMSTRLAGAARPSFVSSAVEWIGPGILREITAPAGCGAADILADPHAVHTASMFRWTDWQDLGGFDEELPALECADLWVRLLGRGPGTCVAVPLLRRRRQPRALHSREWGTPEYEAAARSFYLRHAALALDRMPDVLEAKASLSFRQFDRHALLRAERDAATLELARLDSDGENAGAPALPGFPHGARTTPVSHDWGYERGTPVDRPAIERFLAAHASDIRGSVLEVQEDDYTRRFGGTGVTTSDVIDIATDNPRATSIGDLRSPDHLADGLYDCIILTQTLHVIDDMAAVLRACRRLLRPGGVLLATLPAASRVCLEYGGEGDLWRVTEAGARRIFSDVFGGHEVATAAYGNAVLNAAFAMGLASEELHPAVHDATDPYFPLIVGVRATNTEPRRARCVKPPERRRGLVLLYHRVGTGAVDPHQLRVPAAAFRAQIEWLTAHCEVVPLRGMVGGRVDRGAAVTFDDGYLDNLTCAAPILEELSVPATFFLTTSDEPVHYWWDRLARALLGRVDTPSWLRLELPTGRLDVNTDSPSARRAAHDAIYDAIVRQPPRACEAILEQLLDWSGQSCFPSSERRLNRDEVRHLAGRPGCDLGAHTTDHLFLPSQSDEVLWTQVHASRRVLAERTGQPIDAFAYPFGAMDDRARAAAARAGFNLAVACTEEAVTECSDRFALPRVQAIDEPLASFVARVERVLEG